MTNHSIWRSLLLPFAAPLLAIACGSSDEASSAPPPVVEPANTIASVVSINQIAVYQGVKVTLVDNGVVAKPKAPIIAARPGLVRVHAAQSTKAIKLAPMIAELRVRTPGREDVLLTDGPRSLRRLDDAVLDSTFRFNLTAEQIVPGTTVSVEIRDADPNSADKSRARFVVPPPVDPAADPEAEAAPTPTPPAEQAIASELPLDAKVAPKLKVKFAPVIYGADGSDRVPPLDAGVVEAYRTALYKMYPVSEVELTVRDAFNWPLVVQANGDGWDALLAAVIKTRQDDKAADDVYYVGVFTPAATEREYCKKGCILGVAPSGFTNAVDLRSAMIVGYPSERSHGTLAQELAHAMGRLHAPCGRPNSIDPKFPYEDGDIGVWGWDVIRNELVDPAEHSDFMSYCGPVWVSDYTWNGIFDHMARVEATKNGSRSANTQQTKSFQGGESSNIGAALRSGGDVLIDRKQHMRFVQ